MILRLRPVRPRVGHLTKQRREYVQSRSHFKVAILGAFLRRSLEVVIGVWSVGTVPVCQREIVDMVGADGGGYCKLAHGLQGSADTLLCHVSMPHSYDGCAAIH